MNDDNNNVRWGATFWDIIITIIGCEEFNADQFNSFLYCAYPFVFADLEIMRSRNYAHFEDSVSSASEMIVSI